ncbi:ATP-grasp domain-containing protein [Pseudomonas putida]|uniref:ATP-grasp domain-containing protein n=1 Tax=Pseudomonas putida TaxID=303 RepID=UPI0018AA5B05|nr:ATP-grasp domain-containing protein [Pseudomonas putida]MBF8649202.1 ATP-grasp domain-containing protein [Pseudomonas putida]MBF8653829.1 ATP-grasp domain-containing protein [Pseudomonas putida]
MKILILHRVPYPRIEYHRGIDHVLHEVTYFGKQAAIDTLPADLQCERVVRAGTASASEEALAWLSDSPQHFDRIISMSEYELLDAARLREALGVEGASVQTVTLARNKLLMKEAVQAHGLRIPRFMSLACYLEAQGQVPWAGKTVFKPHSGASSADVSVHVSSQAHSEIRRKIHEQSLHIDDFQVEEYIAGPIRHFDGLVLDGRIVTMQASEYVGTCLAYMEQGAPLGSWHVDSCASTREWVGQALNAVQITQGAFHLEAIMDANGPVFLEVGNRVGGADVVATYEMATGIHLPSLELRIYVEGELDFSTLSGRQADLGYGWFVFPGHTHPQRTFHGLEGAGELRSSPCIVQWNELEPGAPLPGHVTYSAFEAPLAGIVKTADPERTRDWIGDLFSRVSLARHLTSVA